MRHWRDSALGLWVSAPAVLGLRSCQMRLDGSRPVHLIFAIALSAWRAFAASWL